MPVPSRPRPDRRQMDGVDHPIALEADNALRRAPPRDRWDFPKNAHANSSQPGTGRSGRAQGLSSRSTESRVFAFRTGSDVDRTVARALPLVRKTSGRIAGQSRPRESEATRANLIGALAANSFALKLLIPMARDGSGERARRKIARASVGPQSVAVSCRVNSAIRVNTNNDMRVWIIFMREALVYRFFAGVLGRHGPR